MNYLPRLCFVVCFLLVFAGAARAQCPTAESYSTSSTAATCPSNGSITLSNSADQAVTGGMGVPGALYQIISGPAGGGYQTTAQSANRFDGLPPGAYSISVTKESCPTITKMVTVANQYTQIALTPVVSNLCPGNNQIGATITANTTGGTAPIQYAFVKSPNANISDNELTYGSSNTFQVTSATGGYGVYQVRAKDACGVFVTYSVDIAPTKPLARYVQGTLSKTNCSEYRMTGALTTGASGGTSLTGSAGIGYRVELFDVTSVPNPCAIPTGATALRDVVFTSGDFGISVPLSARRFVVRTTSPCGESVVTCLNLSSNAIFNPTPELFVTPSCEVTQDVRKMNLYARLSGASAPIQVTIKNTSTGEVIQTDTWTGSTTSKQYKLAYLAGGYTVDFVDACGLTATQPITPPGEGAAVVTSVSTNLTCATVLGSRRVIVTLSGGAVGFLDSGTQVLLVSGPAGAISPGLAGSFNASQSQIYWNNLFPGIYTARIIPSSSTYPACSATDFTFTVNPFPTSPTGSSGLTFSLAGSVNALCGGTGTISTQLTYNGGQPVSYQLTNSGGTVLASNQTGTFTNVASGTYTVRAFAQPCGGLVEATKSFVVPVADQPPLISKQLGVICEDGNAQTAVGKAAFEFSGFGPFSIEVKPADSPTWATVATGVNGSSYTINSLTANVTYDVRLTDNCGKSAVTTVSIKPLEAQLSVLTTVQPCVGQSYTLEAPDFPGTTYTWTKDGNPVSTDRTVSFASYLASYDGTYTVLLSVAGGCVIRTITATLNSAQCAGTLPVALKSFTARIQPNQTVLLEWATASEVNNSYFRLERSRDLQAFETLAQVPARDGGQRGAAYRHVDAAPIAGTSYYRLHQVDQDGTNHPLRAVSVVLRSDDYGVYPNPVNGSQFSVRLDDPRTARLSLFNAAGRRLVVQKGELESGLIKIRVATSLTPGLYLLLVEERGQTRRHRVIVR